MTEVTSTPEVDSRPRIAVPEDVTKMILTKYAKVHELSEELQRVQTRYQLERATFGEYLRLTMSAINVPKDGGVWDLLPDGTAFVKLANNKEEFEQMSKERLIPEKLLQEPKPAVEGQINAEGEPIPTPVENQKDHCTDAGDVTG